MVTRSLVLFLALTASGLAQAEVYTWQDAQGRTHFGDRPPAESAPRRLELEINSIHRPELPPSEAGPAGHRRVVIYTTDWCGVCRQAKSYFRRERIAYTEYDVENSRKGREDYRRLKGSGVPIILVGDRRMNGFSPDRFERLYDRP